MTPRAALSLVLVFLGAGLTACGGEGLSREQFAKEASRICTSLEKKITAIGAGASGREQIGDALDKVIDQTRKSVAELKNLEQPEGDAGKTAGNFVDALESDVEDTAIPAFEDLRDALKSNDQAAAQAALKEIEKLESANKSDKFAKQLGAKACAG